MDIERFEAAAADVRVPYGEVQAALADARSARAVWVDRAVALSVARGSTKTAQLRLERLARVVMTADSRIRDPREVWSANWASVRLDTVELLDRIIAERWDSASTRNAMRDAVRAVVRAALDAGMLTHDQARPRLNALRPERAQRDPEKQARGHISASRVEAVFRELAADRSATARRDAAAIALMVGSGLRRAEVCAADLSDLDEHLDRMVIRGKGDVVRDVALAAGVRRALLAWLAVRGDEEGPLLTPVSREAPRQPELGRRMSANTIAQLVARRFGEGVSPHDLRRTFVGDLLDSGADLSVVSQLAGHGSPATTAGYDRRGFVARRAAVDRLYVPFVEAEEPGEPGEAGMAETAPERAADVAEEYDADR